MSNRVLIDTNVFISALLSQESPPSLVMRLCLTKSIKPMMGTTLYTEYCDVCSRDHIFKNSALNKVERYELFDDFISLCEWISVYYLWRPNLRDEGDNHLLELATASQAKYIITGNTKDFEEGDLLFPDITIVTPREFIEQWRN
jgi:putative PIN family toxin of toxin-antitoxin system